MNVQCPSCKIMVNFECEDIDRRMEASTGFGLLRALVIMLKDGTLKNPAGDNRWTCPRCRKSLWGEDS